MHLRDRVNFHKHLQTRTIPHDFKHLFIDACTDDNVLCLTHIIGTREVVGIIRRFK